MAIEEDRADLGGQTSGDTSTIGDDNVRHHPLVPPAICCALYALLTILLFGHLGSMDSGSVTGPQTVDQIAELWWLKWVQYAIWHGHNPFLTDWQNYPVGVNALVNASMLALGTAVSPITKLYGPVVSWNILVRVAAFTSALSMCLVLRRWVRWWPAVFFGGLFYGFSVYETSQGARNLQLSFVALPPILFLLLYEIMLRQRWRASRTGVALGLVCSIQFLISTEILVSSVLMALVGCGLYVVTNRESIAAKWPYIKKGLLFGLVTGAVLLFYPLIMVLFGPGHIDGVPNSPGDLAKLHGDLAGIFVPGYLQPLGGSHLATFWVNSIMLYIGIPFFAAVFVTVFFLRRRGIVVMAGLLMAFSVILSLGSTLYVGGHDTHIPLPFIVLAHLPGTDGLLSTRFSLYTVLFGSAVLAIGIDALYRHITKQSEASPRSSLVRKAIALSVASVAVLVIGLPMLPLHTEQLSASGAPSPAVADSLHAIPSGSVVLAYPYPDKPISAIPFTYKYQSIDNALLDQAMTGMNFKLIGGYDWRPWTPNGHQSYGTPQASRLKPASIQALFGSSFYGFATPAQEKLLGRTDATADLRLFMHKYDVGTVIVLPLGQYPFAVIAQIEATIGKPSQLKGAFVWYDVQRRLTQG